MASSHRALSSALRAVLCCACVFGVAGYESVYPSPRVILGRAVDQFNVSFYCTLFVEFPSDAGTSLCGCVVFSPGVVLSAAHCFQKALDDYGGKEYFSSAHVRLYGQMHPVSAALTRLDHSGVYVHPGHSSQTLQNDIAVFHLPMVSTTEVVKLNERAESWEILGPTDRLNVVGIGRTETGDVSAAYDSQGALSMGLPRESQLSSRSCSEPSGFGSFQGWSWEAYGGDICAGPLNACTEGRCADSCNGDSGGPLYRRAEDSPLGVMTLFGVVSRGWECGVVGGYPGIYAPIHKHLTFIQKARSLQASAFDAPVGGSAVARFSLISLIVVALLLI
jgi:secreted trypsin-like serine protease